LRNIYLGVFLVSELSTFLNHCSDLIPFFILPINIILHTCHEDVFKLVISLLIYVKNLISYNLVDVLWRAFV
jgi:hypothetical protein